MKKIFFIFYALMFYSIDCFDEALRPLLPFKSCQEAVEYTDRSTEITPEVQAYTHNTRLLPYRAFHITCDDGIDSILITDIAKRRYLAGLVYVFYKSVTEQGSYVAPYIFITKIKIARQLRGGGLGSALFNYMRTRNYPERISNIRLTASPSDYEYENKSHRQALGRLMHFYEKQGMVLDNTGETGFILYL